MRIIVAYSGGKDSQACLIWTVKKYGAKNVTAVFCDTGWENEETYKHIVETCKALGVELVIQKSQVYDGMIDLAKKKGRFPSTKARFCTEELKSKAFIDYVLEQKEHLLIIQGIRALESHTRSKMKSQCRFFKYYFEPYATNSSIVEHLESLEKLTVQQKKKLKKAKDRLANGKEDPKYHTYRKVEVKAWCEKYSDDIHRPFFNETGLYVIDYILKNGQKPCILYYRGSKRVGCYPCIMSGLNELLEILKRDPELFDRIYEWELEIGSSFFKIDAIPEWARTGVCPRTGKKYTTAMDMKRYLINKNATGDMFAQDEPVVCSSFYHLCE